MDPHSLFDLNDHFRPLGPHGDPFEVLNGQWISMFSGMAGGGLCYGDSSKGGRLPFEPVAMIKILSRRRSTVCAMPDGVHDPGLPELDAISQLLSWRSDA